MVQVVGSEPRQQLSRGAKTRPLWTTATLDAAASFTHQRANEVARLRSAMHHQARLATTSAVTTIGPVLTGHWHQRVCLGSTAGCHSHVVSNRTAEAKSSRTPTQAPGRLCQQLSLVSRNKVNGQSLRPGRRQCAKAIQTVGRIRLRPRAGGLLKYYEWAGFSGLPGRTMGSKELK